MSILAELAYWQQTSLRVAAGLVAVLLPAGTLVYLAPGRSDYPFDDWTELFARATPRGPQVHDHRDRL